MNQSMNHTTQQTVTVVRVAEQHWHALEELGPASIDPTRILLADVVAPRRSPPSRGGVI